MGKLLAFLKLLIHLTNDFCQYFSRGRDFGRDNLGLRDGSEMVVADVCVKGLWNRV